MGGDMKRSVHNRFVVLILLLLAMIASAMSPAIFQVAAAQETPATTAVSTAPSEQPEESETAEVTDLPETGRGHGSDSLAVHHMLMTMLVLIAAAVAALGGIAIFWQYQRR